MERTIFDAHNAPGAQKEPTNTVVLTRARGRQGGVHVSFPIQPERAIPARRNLRSSLSYAPHKGGRHGQLHQRKQNVGAATNPDAAHIPSGHDVQTLDEPSALSQVTCSSPSLATPAGSCRQSTAAPKRCDESEEQRRLRTAS